MAEDVGRDALREPRFSDRLVQRLLYVFFLQMVTPAFLRLRQEGQRLLRKEPLPDEFFGNVPVFFIERIVEKRSRITHGKVLVMELPHRLYLRKQLRQDRLRQGNRAAFTALPADSEHPGVEVEIKDPQFCALKKPKPAAVQQFDHEGIRMGEARQNRVDLLPRQDVGDIGRPLHARDVFLFAEIHLQNMPVQKQQGIERLVLR